jgi:molecular chaperone DnaK
MAARLIGIDLGTTYSAIAEFLNGVPRIILTRDGPTLASVVAFRPDKSVVVGKAAKALQAEGDENVVSFVKRNMGNPHYGFPAHGKTYGAVEVSAEILKALKADAEKHLGEKVTDVVITVPAYFQAPQRTDTFAAGKMAGLNVVRLIDEPTSATLAIALAVQARGGKLEGRSFVYDLGGGTFDVSVVDILPEGKRLRVLAYGGDPYLGGKNFDDNLVMIVRGKAKEQYGIDIIGDKKKSSQWEALIEPYKIRLSAADAVEIPVAPGSAQTVRVTRAEYEAACKTRLEQTQMMSEGVLQAADNVDRAEKGHPKRTLAPAAAWQQPAHVLLVGGMTKSPMVTGMLKALSNKEPRVDVNPDEVVALGAACTAAVTAGVLPRDMLEERNAHTLGVIAVARGGGKYVNSPILKKHQPIPCHGSRDYLIRTRPNVTNEYRLFVTQGEMSNVKHPDLKFLGLRRIRVPHTPAGETRITVSIGYNESATEVVTAKTADGTPLEVLFETLRHDDETPIRDEVIPPSAAGTVATVLAVDVSSSMAGTKLTGVQAEGKKFVTARLGTSTGMGVVAYNGNSSVVCRLTKDAAALHTAIDGLIASGGTRFAPALSDARGLLAPVAGARRIVLLTDGQTSDEAATVAEAQLCKQANITIHIIATQDADHAFLGKIGDTLTGTTDAGLGAALSDIPEELDGGPVVGGGAVGEPPPGDELPEIIAQPLKAENLFLALAASPDTAAPALSARLTAKQGEWTKDVNNQDPDVQTRARLLLEQVPALRRIIDAPDRLTAEASEARKLLKDADGRRLQQADNLVKQLGADEQCLSSAEVAQVVAQTGLPEPRVRALVAEHKFEVIDPPPVPPYPRMNAVQWDTVAGQLRQLHLTDLYALLGGSPKGEASALAAAAGRLHEKLTNEGGTTAEAQTRQALCAAARTIFASPESKAEYDHSRAFAAMEPVRAEVVGRAGANKRLSIEAQQEFRTKLRHAFPDDAGVDAFLRDAAAKAGITLDRKKRGGPPAPILVRCPQCHKLADQKAAKCPDGHSMFPACPKCKTPNHVGEQVCGRATCGQNLLVKPEAEDLARLAGRLLSGGQYAEAGQQAALALQLWPGLEAADGVRRAVAEKMKADETLKKQIVDRIQLAIDGKRHVAALGELEHAPEDATTRDLRTIATVARDKAVAKVKEGESLLDASPDAAYEAFEAAAQLCVDLPEAHQGLMRCPAEPAGPVTATPTASGVTLSWVPSPTHKGRVSYRAYLFDRPPADAPDGGTLIGETSEPRCAVRLAANQTYYAAVVALRDGVANPHATVAGPFLRADDAADLRAVAANGEVAVSFTPPSGAVRVEWIRATDQRPSDWSAARSVPAGSSQFTDRSVENGRRYHYLVRAVYRMPDGSERTSAGEACAATPAERADAVTELDVTYRRGHVAHVEFDAPPTGEVLLYASPTPPRFSPGTPLAETDLSAFGAAVRTHGKGADYQLTPGEEVFFTAVTRNGGVLTAGACHPALAIDPVRGLSIQYGSEDGDLTAVINWPDGADVVRVLSSPTGMPTAFEDALAHRTDLYPPAVGGAVTCRWTVESPAEVIYVAAFARAARPAAGPFPGRNYTPPPATAEVGGTRRTLHYVVRPVYPGPRHRGLLSRMFGKAPEAVAPTHVVGVELVIVPSSPTVLPEFHLRHTEGRRPLDRKEGRRVEVLPADGKLYGPTEPYVRTLTFDPLPLGGFRLFPATPNDIRGWRLIDVPGE